MTEADWQSCCVAHGMTMTAPRKAILGTLLQAGHPCDAVALLQATRERHAGIKLDTVYRFLRQLEKSGLAHAQRYGRIRWQLCEPPLAEPAPPSSGATGALCKSPCDGGLDLLKELAARLGYRLLP